MSDELDDRVLGTDKRRLRSLVVIATIAFRADRGRTIALLTTATLEALGGAIGAYALKLVIDAVAARDVGTIVRTVAWLAVASLITSFSNIGTFMLNLRVMDSVQLVVDEDLIDLTSGIAGLEHHERPDYVDQVERLRERRRPLAFSVNNLVSVIRTVVQALSTIALIGSVHPVLLLLPVFGLPSFFLEARAERMRRKMWETTTEPLRAASHLFELTTTSAPAKELRIFGVARELIDRHRRIRLETQDRVLSTHWRALGLSSFGWALFALGYGAAVLFVATRVIAGDAGPGDVALVVALGTQVNQQLSGLVYTFSQLLQALDVVRRYLWLRDQAEAGNSRPADVAPVPARLIDGIRFEGVRFAYPGTERDVLTKVDVLIPAGSTVAVVGDNGAGKTTLIKLLCRFYEPTDGRITVDGVDISRFDVWEWRERMAAGFQDFAKFEFLARETVGVGDVPRIDDEPTVLGALERAAATDVISAMPAQLGTQLGKSFEDGHELSGGQWQKLALGRAMMREAPLLLVLDEPTAALDAETEYALFERYAGAAREAARETGAITVLVSHRFSTVRMADLIVVVDSGGVVESGTHEELQAGGGLYAELYELQARGYR